MLRICSLFIPLPPHSPFKKKMLTIIINLKGHILSWCILHATQLKSKGLPNVCIRLQLFPHIRISSPKCHMQDPDISTVNLYTFHGEMGSLLFPSFVKFACLSPVLFSISSQNNLHFCKPLSGFNNICIPVDQWYPTVEGRAILALDVHIRPGFI